MIEMNGIKKAYQTGKISFEALRGIDLKIQENEYIAIVGQSGSGKSTLMNLMGCLDTPTDGQYTFEGQKVDTLSPNRLADIRNKRIGFVFQAFNLLPYATAYENVELPLLYAGMGNRERKARVAEVLASVGLADKMANLPTEMSGGEMQRTAIARALGNSPKLILADEPTGNLDTKSGKEIVNIFDTLWQKGHTIIIITHDMGIADGCRRVIRLKDGLLDNDKQNGNGLNKTMVA